MAITPAFQADNAGSIPAARSKFADMAQSVERILGKDEVPSSILGISTISSWFYFLLLYYLVYLKLYLEDKNLYLILILKLFVIQILFTIVYE